MQTLDVSYNLLEGDITDFTSSFLKTYVHEGKKEKKNMKRLVIHFTYFYYSVDLSGNHFKGSAPTFASSTSITSLSLQANNFEGMFQIGNLSLLRVLQIGQNQFTGMLVFFFFFFF